MQQQPKEASIDSDTNEDYFTRRAFVTEDGYTNYYIDLTLWKCVYKRSIHSWYPQVTKLYAILYHLSVIIAITVISMT